MILLIDDQNAELHQAEIQGFRELLVPARHDGMTPFRLTAERSNVSEADLSSSFYVVLQAEGRVVAGARLVRAEAAAPDDRPEFQFLKFFKKLPRGVDVLDIAELVVLYDESDKRELSRRTHEMLCALHEFALNDSAAYFVAVIGAPMFSTLVLSGLPAQALSFPATQGEGLVLAVQIPVHEASLHSLYRITENDLPRLPSALPAGLVASESHLSRSAIH